MQSSLAGHVLCNPPQAAGQAILGPVFWILLQMQIRSSLNDVRLETVFLTLAGERRDLIASETTC